MSFENKVLTEMFKSITDMKNPKMFNSSWTNSSVEYTEYLRRTELAFLAFLFPKEVLAMKLDFQLAKKVTLDLLLKVLLRGVLVPEMP